MAYEKYNLTNDAQSNLDAPITASATSIALVTGAGSKFPSSKFILKFVQYTTTADPTTPVVKYEYILVTNRSGDTLTVTRGFDGSTPASFLAGDFVYLTNHKAITKDIQDEVTRLESDKLNKGGLRTALANTWRMFFSNGSNAETELSFGASGTYLKSTGSGSTPTWDTPPLDINSQTEDNADVTASDFLAWHKNGTGTRKRVSKASTSIMGILKIATDGNFDAGTDTEKAITANHIKTRLGIASWSSFTLSASGSAGGTPSITGTGKYSRLGDNNKTAHFFIDATISKGTCAGDVRIHLPLTATNQTIYFHTVYATSSGNIDNNRKAYQASDSYMNITSGLFGTKLQWADVTNDTRVFISGTIETV